MTELRDGRLDQFSDSFNLILGSTDNDFDFFDNPYIEVNVYERTQLGNNLSLIKLKKCSRQDLMKFMDEEIAKLYKNALCFDDLS